MADPQRPRPRRPRAARPLAECLEGRALMAASLFDPTFGRRGVAVGAVDTGSQLSNVTATAVQADGKVVVAGTYLSGGTGSSSPAISLLAVARYNADGTVDATFGTDGQVDVPLPSGSTGVITAPRNIVIDANGSITLAAAVAAPATTSGGPAAQQVGLVARVNSAGSLDGSFGSGGEYATSATVGGFSSVALQPDGKVLAAGGSVGSDQLRVVRLTTAGVPDTSFNTTGTLDVALGRSYDTSTTTYLSTSSAGIALNADGQIYVASNSSTVGTFFFGRPQSGGGGQLTRIDPDGTLDASYQQGGTGQTGLVAVIGDVAVQRATGDVIVAGGRGTSLTPTSLTLARFLPSGELDASFAGLNITTSTSPYGILRSIALGADGSITVAGTGYTYGPNPIGILNRFTADGALDATFGKGGQYSFTINPPGGYTRNSSATPAGVALAPNGDIIVAGPLVSDSAANSFGVRQSYVAAIRAAASTSPSNQSVAGDYNGDGRTDAALYLPATGAFAITPSSSYASSPYSGGAGYVTPFGSAGAGASIPVAGDFDGDGKADIAVYLTATGQFAVSPSGGAPAQLTAFGSAGAGASIPVPGDYDGDGKTDLAVYLPALGAFAVKPSDGAPAYLFAFGSAGAGASIPVVGDFDGDGRTDFAVYLPATGQFAVKPSDGAPAYLFAFGSAGAGASIPAVGDYDGDGRSDFAVYLVNQGAFAVSPSSGRAGAITAFGGPGAGASIPVPGDYDGDGRTDLAVYLTGRGLYATRPSTGGVPDNVVPFGPAGPGQSLPSVALPPAPGLSARSFAAATPARSADYLVALDVDLPTPTTAAKKSKG